MSSSPTPLSTLESFFCGGLAACVAVTISNPAEVAKTRLQLQGELAKDGGQRVYTSAVDVLRKTWRNEGMRGIQRGLPPGYVYQILLNGSRLGFYEPIRRTVNSVLGFTPTDQIAYTSVMAGAASGVVGASLGNPMFLIKARMQAYSPALPVGAQHNYKSSFDALRSIYLKDGPRGLVRGMDAAVLRTAAGSSVQLPSYNWTKTQIVKRGWLPADSTWTFLASSTVSGACVCMVMQPFDTALTRVYNQPTERRPNGRGGFKTVGLLYRNPIDCLWKTVSTEGVAGLYKGSTAHFLRIAPHTIVTLTANELIIGLYRRFRDKSSFMSNRGACFLSPIARFLNCASMAVASLRYSFNDACPITWPQATALMLDYPLIPQMPESVADFVHRVYIEALWLPESIISFSHLVHSLRRVQDSGTEDSSLLEALRPLLLPLRSIEKKYQEYLPGLLHDPAATMDREVVEPEENAMWYAWHHGKPPPRHFPDPDHIDEEKWKKQWMIDMERREVLVQILLHFLYLAVSSSITKRPSPPPDRSRKRKRKSLRGSPAKRKGNQKSPSLPPFSPEENLDMLTDRMAIWQATEEDSEKFLKRPGDNDRDWMRVFCEDDVRPLFSQQLPDQIRQFEEKLTSPSVLERRADSDEDAMPGLETKSKKARKAPTHKPTLTEADLTDGFQRGGSKNSVKRKESSARAFVRSRSISVEPDAESRRSRSRSVSLAAEDLKSVGGKRGGIAGNSKLFASEVDMRRQTTGSTGSLKKVSSTTNMSFADNAGSQCRESSVERTAGGTTLVAETPPRPSSKQSWTSIDDDGVPESPELVYLGSRSAEQTFPETPVKSKQTRKR